MLMINEIDKLHESGMSIEAAGFLFYFSTCIEWNTGRLCNRRNGASLTIKDISNYMGIGITNTRKVLNELIKFNAIFYDHKKRGYFINNTLIQKGRNINENKI